MPDDVQVNICPGCLADTSCHTSERLPSAAMFGAVKCAIAERGNLSARPAEGGEHFLIGIRVRSIDRSRMNHSSPGWRKRRCPLPLSREIHSHMSSTASAFDPVPKRFLSFFGAPEGNTVLANGKLDGYVTVRPPHRKAIDALQGWNHAVPPQYGVQAGTGHFHNDPRILWAINQAGPLANSEA